MTCSHVSCRGRAGRAPAEPGDGTVKSTGITSFPSPITTINSRPSIPSRTRGAWPLYQVPTRPSCWPYFVQDAVIARPRPRPPTAGRRCCPDLPPSAGPAVVARCGNGRPHFCWGRAPRSVVAGSCPGAHRVSSSGCDRHPPPGNSTPKIFPTASPATFAATRPRPPESPAAPSRPAPVPRLARVAARAAAAHAPSEGGAASLWTLVVGRVSGCMGSSCGVGISMGEGAHGPKFPQFQDLSRSHSLISLSDRDSVANRKSQLIFVCNCE